MESLQKLEKPSQEPPPLHEPPSDEPRALQQLQLQPSPTSQQPSWQEQRSSKVLSGQQRGRTHYPSAATAG